MDGLAEVEQASGFHRCGLSPVHASKSEAGRRQCLRNKSVPGLRAFAKLGLAHACRVLAYFDDGSG
jgi:hypothetical protein